MTCKQTTVELSNVASPSAEDVVAAYSPPTADPRATAPIKVCGYTVVRVCSCVFVDRYQRGCGPRVLAMRRGGCVL
jgi:hypothetical protein